MDKSTNALNWFEIPVTDLERAKHFYQVSFGIHMDETEMMGMHMAAFPYDPMSGKAAGAIVKSEMHIPATDGTLVYLNANPSISEVLERIESEGGRIILPKTEISAEIGFMAIFIDTEGNRVGVHARN